MLSIEELLFFVRTKLSFMGKLGKKKVTNLKQPSD